MQCEWILVSLQFMHNIIDIDVHIQYSKIFNTGLVIKFFNQYIDTFCHECENFADHPSICANNMHTQFFISYNIFL